MGEQNTPEEKAVQQGKRDLTTGSVTSTMLLFAVPMIMGNVLQQCYNLADTWIVGKFVGAGALAAVGSAYTLMTFLTSILTGMCMGGGALFSICYGRRDIRKMKEYMVSSFVLILGITVLLTAASFALLHPILRLMQIPLDVYEMMYDYMWIILFGLPFIFLYNYFAFLLRSVGNSVTPLVFLGVSTVLNIGLDYVFVAVFDWNVEGAAIATVLAQIISGIGIAAYSFAKEDCAAPEAGGAAGKREHPGRDFFLFRSNRNTAVSHEFRDPYGTGTCEQLRDCSHGCVRGRREDRYTGVYAGAGIRKCLFHLYFTELLGLGKKDRIRKGSKSAVVVVLMFCLAASAVVFLLARQAHGNLYLAGRDGDDPHWGGISSD